MSGSSIILMGRPPKGASLPSSLVYENIVTFPGNSLAGFGIDSNGNIYGDGNVQKYTGTWNIGTYGSLNNEYEVNFSSIFGPVQGSATSSWQSLGQYWYAENTGSLGTVTVSGTLQIRDKTTQQVYISTTVTLYARVSP